MQLSRDLKFGITDDGESSQTENTILKWHTFNPEI